MKSSHSIRTQLYALVFAVAIPLTLLLAYTLYNSVREHENAARESISRLAQITASDAQTFIEQSRVQLEHIAQRPLVRKMDPAQCDPFLEDYLAIENHFTNISVTDSEGIVICAAIVSPVKISVADKPWFREVMQTGQTVVSQPQVGILSRKWIASIALPVLDDARHIVGTISLSIDLVRFPLVTKNAPMVPGAFIGIQNRAGVIVSRWPDAEKWVGHDARGTPLTEITLRQSSGQARAVGLDGLEKIFGFTPIPGTDWIAVAGVPATVVFSNVRDEVVRNILSVLVLGFLVAMVTFFIRRHIEAPIFAVAEAARAVSEGKLDTRAAESGPVEIAAVARQFNAILDNRVLTDEALRVGQERFRLALQNSSIAVFTQDLDLRYTWVYNPTLGNAEDMLGKTDEDIFEDADDALRVSKLKRAVIETGTSSHHEVVIHRHKTKRYYDITLEPLRNSAGAVVGLSGVAIDITLRMEHENALQLAANAFESTLDGIMIIDSNRRIVSVNKAFTTITGYTAEYAVGRTPEFFEAPDSPGTPYRDIWQGLEENGYWHGEVWRQRANGEIYPELLRINSVKNENLATTHYVKVFNDISLRREQENALQLAANAFESTLDGIMIIGADRRIVSVNKAFTTITGYTEEQAIGRSPEFLEAPDSPGTPYRDIWQGLEENGYWHGEVWRQRANGEIYPELLRINSVKNENLSTKHYVKVFNDISLQVDTAERLDFLAHHDALTNLPNRVLYLKKAEEAMVRAGRRGTRVGVIFIDLDRFKAINDSLGHQVGDQVLQAAAKRLSDHVRETDIVARFGGDEFAVLLDDLRYVEEMQAVAEKLLYELSQPFTCLGHELYTSASIGVSWFPQDASDIHTLLKNADVAMYRAKDHGKNTYEMFSPEMNAEAMENLAMTNSLHLALERDEFLLHYQPRVQLTTGRVTGVEALIRWQHPTLGLIPPARFIHLAEESGIIARIGEWVLKVACEQMSAWHREGIPPLRIAVNLSARQFRQPDLVERTDAILRQAQLDPTCLELEITETVVIRDPDNTRVVLDLLKELGIKIAIDDFGIGHSSLAYLKRFPIDFLKIDKSFIQNIPENSDDVGITQAIIALAKSLKLKLIAEGVENEEQHMFLHSLGCDEGQGYHFQVPKDARETGRFLHQNMALSDSEKVIVKLPDA